VEVGVGSRLAWEGGLPCRLQAARQTGVDEQTQHGEEDAPSTVEEVIDAVQPIHGFSVNTALSGDEQITNWKCKLSNVCRYSLAMIPLTMMRDTGYKEMRRAIRINLSSRWPNL
jgi:hypothetical protein